MATYTVKLRDSLSRIAMKIYCDDSRWRELASLNSITNPDLIYIGQRLELPDPTSVPLQTSEWPPQRAPTAPALLPRSQPVSAPTARPGARC